VCHQEQVVCSLQADAVRAVTHGLRIPCCNPSPELENHTLAKQLQWWCNIATAQL